MKLGTRIISMVMAVMLVAAATVSGVFAKENPLPDQSRDGNASIIVHKYGVDASYQTTYESTGKEIAPGTVVGKQQDGAGDPVPLTLGELQPLEGIRFTIVRVKEVLDADGYVKTPITYTVDSTFDERTKATGANGLLAFEDLAFGIYRITEEPSTAVTQGLSAPVYVSVPMADPTDSEKWLYDIHVYPKNEIQGPEVNKSVSYAGNQYDTVDMAQRVKWIITGQIPADMADVKTYIITDKLHKALRYADAPDKLEVSYIDAATEKKTLLTEGDTEDYVLTYTQGAGAYPWKDALVVELTAAGKAKAANALSGKQGAALPVLTVEFYTVFDIPAEHIADYLGVAIDNQAQLDLTNSANVVYTVESEKPEVHFGGVRLLKVDPEGQLLGGAEFKIYRTKADALAGTNAIADPDEENKDWVVVSSALTGLAEFRGLAYGKRATAETGGEAYNTPDAETDYWIVEVKAPVDTADGKAYNLLKEPLKVTVNAASHDESNVIRVVNSKFSLPLTGGAGTLVFTVSGLILLGVGACFFLMSKRSGENKRKSKQDGHTEQ